MVNLLMLLFLYLQIKIVFTQCLAHNLMDFQQKTVQA